MIADGLTFVRGNVSTPVRQPQTPCGWFSLSPNRNSDASRRRHTTCPMTLEEFGEYTHHAACEVMWSEGAMEAFRRLVQRDTVVAARLFRRVDALQQQGVVRGKQAGCVVEDPKRAGLTFMRDARDGLWTVVFQLAQDGRRAQLLSVEQAR